jgi:hypothetical protein
MLRPIAVYSLFLSGALAAQTDDDTLIRVYQLVDVVVKPGVQVSSVEGFMGQVMEDTTFQHAFLNTRFFPHNVKSNLKVRNKGEKETASLFRRGRLIRSRNAAGGAVAELVLDSVHESGRLRERDGDIRFLTAEMYDDVFFPKGPYVASNRIRSRELEISKESRFDKYRSELKKFMFNPGQEIASVPFIGDKLDLFAPDMAPQYDFAIDDDVQAGQPCYVFTAVAKDSINGEEADEDDTVIKRMKTWFDQGTMNVVAREYRIAHESMLLDFDISISVRNTIIDGELVPLEVRYDGAWDIPFRKKEIVRFNLLYSDWSITR